jgi:hypothetical protein
VTKKTIPRRDATAPTDPNALVPHATVLALAPQVLHSQAEASVRALLAEGESANTVRSYASAFRYWAAWFRLRYRTGLTLPLPIVVTTRTPDEFIPVLNRLQGPRGAGLGRANGNLRASRSPPTARGDHGGGNGLLVTRGAAGTVTDLIGRAVPDAYGSVGAALQTAHYCHFPP